MSERASAPGDAELLRERLLEWARDIGGGQRSDDLRTATALLRSTTASAARPYSIQEIPDFSVSGVHYRITDADDNRVATCFLRENAELVCDALNRAGAPSAARVLVCKLCSHGLGLHRERRNCDGVEYPDPRGWIEVEPSYAALLGTPVPSAGGESDALRRALVNLADDWKAEAYRMRTGDMIDLSDEGDTLEACADELRALAGTPSPSKGASSG